MFIVYFKNYYFLNISVLFKRIIYTNEVKNKNREKREREIKNHDCSIRMTEKINKIMNRRIDLKNDPY